jgi:hypothetical protein
MVTVFEPHVGVLNVTLPFCFLTVTLKTAGVEPLTLFDAGETWIWPLLLDVAVIVVEPVRLLATTEIEPEPF